MQKKKVLVISPFFPPANTADMQRIRISLPFFKEFEWDAEVVTVEPSYLDATKDPLLLKNIPEEIKIHQVKALSKSWTRKIGLGSIALRSMWYYFIKVNALLRSKKYDLIYFTTTEFPLCILGAYWKNKFSIPYVIDMQDPWHSEYYQDKPKHERPPKYWFSYRLNKYLEPIAMKSVNGLLSVSQAYLDVLTERYPYLKNIPQSVITFGAFKNDFDLVLNENQGFDQTFESSKDEFNFVYIGRGGYDMKDSIVLLFEAFRSGLEKYPEIFKQIRFRFIGTSYAPKGEGKPTIAPIAHEYGLEQFVFEQTDRIPYYQNINTLLSADALLIIGSNDPQYTASKIYPYIMAKRPLLAIFNPLSSAAKIIAACQAGYLVSLTEQKQSILNTIIGYLKSIVQQPIAPQTNWDEFEPYTAKNMTKRQVELFEEAILNFSQEKNPH